MTKTLHMAIRINERGHMEFAEGDMFNSEIWHNTNKEDILKRISELIDGMVK